MMMSDDITAGHVASEQEDKEKLRKLWTERVSRPARARKRKVPHIKIIHSPYRKIYEPILNFVNDIAQEKPDRIIAVLIPELAEPHWWEYLLHNLHGARLKTMFYLKGGERVIVIRVPWHLRDV